MRPLASLAPDQKLLGITLLWFAAFKRYSYVTRSSVTLLLLPRKYFSFLTQLLGFVCFLEAITSIAAYDLQ